MISLLYQVLADAVLALHVLFVAFVLLGLAVVLAGAALGWSWVRARWFRLCHVAAIGVVALQAWLGVLCPLTHLEMWLRRQAGQAGYSGSFVEHWLQRLLYYDAPAWVFLLAYTLFLALVVLAWRLVPPRPRGAR